MVIVTDRVTAIRAVLAPIEDPEIPVLTLMDLGIIRDVSADRVLITPTYTGCPATFAIESAIRAALDAAGMAQVRIDTTLTPPWSSDWISASAREKLRRYGIAPPGDRADAPVHCPQCDSSDTLEISRFGSTPCKALWKCNICLEPFDVFKCH